ncbi:MAG: tetratricopeptide repeat protein, partial [Cyanobacteria bacterium REEB65]|nr:tetratricopeptide repeat protein [Cyanobacteria bacterium REEB65]
QFHLLEDAADPAVREAAWYGEGWSALKESNFPRAYYAWMQILDQFPDSPRILEAHLNLANHYLHAGRYALAADQILTVAQMPAMRKAAQTIRVPLQNDPAKTAIAEMDLASLADFVAAEGAANDGDWVRAIANYRSVPPTSRWAEHAAYGLGWVLWRTGRLPEAEDQLQDVLRKYPHGELRAATLYTLGRVQEDRGLGRDAADSYQQALRSGTGKWAEEALYELASLALAGHDMSQAEKWARQLEQDYPTGRFAAPGLWLLAEAELASGDTLDAIANYDRLAHHPEALGFLAGKSDPVVFKLGIAYLRAGHLRSAAKALDQVRGPLADEAMFWRAETLYDLGRFSEAADLYATYLKHGIHAPLAPEASYGLAWSLLKRGDRLGARKAFAEAAANLLDPHLKHDAYYRLSLLAVDAGDYQEATVALENAAAIKGIGPDADAAYFLAFSRMKSGEIQAAAEGFATLVNAAPNSVHSRQARHHLAECDMQLGKFTEAGQLFEDLAQSAATGSDPTDLRLQAATAYTAAGQNDRAATLYNLIATDASASDQTRQDILKPLVTAYLRSNELPQAEDLLVGQASGSVWAPQLLLQVADTYAKQRLWRQAAAVYSEVPDGGPAVQLQRARSLQQSGDLVGAANLFESLAASPSADQAPILLELADLYGQMGVLDKSRATLNRAEEISGSDSTALAKAWFDYGDL